MRSGAAGSDIRVSFGSRESLRKRNSKWDSPSPSQNREGEAQVRTPGWFWMVCVVCLVKSWDGPRLDTARGSRLETWPTKHHQPWNPPSLLRPGMDGRCDLTIWANGTPPNVQWRPTGPSAPEIQSKTLWDLPHYLQQSVNTIDSHHFRARPAT